MLVAGGELEIAGLPVHSSPEEQMLLEQACAEARRVARLVVLFGPAAARLAPFFDRSRILRARTLDEAIALALDTPASEAPAAEEPSPLTAREQEIAALIAEGLSNKAIATSLVVSPRTVDGHLERIFRKLDLTSRAQLAAWVTLRGGSPPVG